MIGGSLCIRESWYIETSGSVNKHHELLNINKSQKQKEIYIQGTNSFFF